MGRRRTASATACASGRAPAPEPTPSQREPRIVGPGPKLIRPALDGLVPYEPGKPVETVQRELGLERVVKLASNEGPFGPFPAALEAIAARRWPSRTAIRTAAASACASALAERHGVAFEEVVVAAGADAVIGYACQATLDPGDEVVTPWPSFPSYVLDPLKLGGRPCARRRSTAAASTSTRSSPR